MNPLSDFQKSKWRVQDGGRQNEKLRILVKMYIRGF